MKRDLDLIRRILLAVEESPSGFAPQPLKLKGYTDEQVGYHAYLLIEAGLVRGSDVTTMGSGAPQALIAHLTWEGHEFLDAARDETRWKKALKMVASEAGGVTLDVLKDILVGLLRGAFGLA